MDKITILGVDQGLANCGYALVEFQDNQYKLLDVGTITTNTKWSLPQRLERIYIELFPLALHANAISAEQLHVTTMGNMSILRSNMVTGVVCLVAGRNDIPFFQIAPMSVKKIITGSGKASKEIVAEKVRTLCHLKASTSYTDHETDAMAIAIATIQRLNSEE